MTHRQLDTSVWDRAVSLCTEGVQSVQRRVISSDKLSALKSAGSSHIYADTADHAEIEDLAGHAGNTVFGEIDGNTVNQPLVHKVIARYLASNDAKHWIELLDPVRERPEKEDLTVVLYTVICGRIGNDVVHRVSSGRAWEISLQLHMRLTGDVEKARQAARSLRRMVPGTIVKVPFAPHEPNCFLLARILEQEGIPVNFTSTFSACQALAAAMLANTGRTNIFLGRLNEGLHAKLLGEHVVLETQRALRQQRRKIGTKTLLIAASLREWQTFQWLAGCDIFTALCSTISGFLSQKEIGPEQIRSRLDWSYEKDLSVSEDIPMEITKRIPRLYRIEPEFIQLLLRLGGQGRMQQLPTGDELQGEFEHAGFSDFFYSPSQLEWNELHKGKLPNIPHQDR
jgi:transaldolase